MFKKIEHIGIAVKSMESANEMFSQLSEAGEGIHHIAFEVENIHTEMTRLKEAGFQLIHEAPKDGADNKSICFIHPKSTNKILIELCMEKPA